MVVGEYAAGNSEQPQPCFLAVWHVAYTAPSDQVHIGEEIGGILAVLGASKQIPENPHSSVSVDVFESLSVAASLEPAHLPALRQLTR